MNAISKLTLVAVLAMSSAIFGVAHAQSSTDSATPTDATQSSGTSGTSSTNQSSQTAAEMSEGEIRKVDKEAGKVTIKHGPLKNLDMPAMTMVFRVKDPAMLEQVKTGDKISFVADKVDGQITVTELQVTQ